MKNIKLAARGGKTKTFAAMFNKAIKRVVTISSILEKYNVDNCSFNWLPPAPRNPMLDKYGRKKK